jgi:hypothetical protein
LSDRAGFANEIDDVAADKKSRERIQMHCFKGAPVLDYRPRISVNFADVFNPSLWKVHKSWTDRQNGRVPNTLHLKHPEGSN